MFCMKCGTEVPDDMNFCPKCGFAFNSGMTQSSYVEQATRQLKITRKHQLSGSAVALEVDLVDESGTCVDSYSLPLGQSCYMTCYCDYKYFLRANTVGPFKKNAEQVIEPGDRNLNIVVSLNAWNGKLQFDIS